MDKRELRLGDEVLWRGAVAVVDALSQGCLGLVVPSSGEYVIASYADVQRKG